MTKREQTAYMCGKVMSVNEKMVDGISHKTKRIWAFGKNFIFEFVGGRCVSVTEH